jgi:hypothetical protein
MFIGDVNVKLGLLCNCNDIGPSISEIYNIMQDYDDSIR